VAARDFLLLPLAFAVAAGGLIWGGKNSYVSLRNRSPLETTCAAYEARPPDTQWLRVRDCILDFDHMGAETSKSSYGAEDVKAVYIPLRSPARPASEPAKLILAIDEGPLLALGSSIGSRQAAIDAWIADVDRFGLPGLIELSVDRSERKRKRLSEIGLHAENFAILGYAAAPRPLALALGALALGLASAGYLAYRIRRARRGRIELARARVVT
jgi:hypothetical protein